MNSSLPSNDTPAPQGMHLNSTPSAPDSSDVLGMAWQILAGGQPGILSTVTSDGHPRARWIATLLFEHFPEFHALTSPESGKMDDLRSHSAVHWLFASPHLDVNISFSGHAHEVFDPEVIRDVWRRTWDKSRAYFLENSPSFSLFETVVEHVDLCIPASHFHSAVKIEDLAALLRKPSH